MAENTAEVVSNAPSSNTQDLFESVKRFKKHFDEVEKHFVERAGEMEQIKYAMLTKEHVLLKGKPGTAKSKLSKYSFGFIHDAKTFAIQLSKFMSEEYLFGAIDINKMRNEGKVEHITDESIVDCEFAFIDEVFDGNDALLRSLLEVLNERTFTRHTQRLVTKLHSAVMTSNYVREDESTEAFLDRILFKSEVKPITSNKNRMAMYHNYITQGEKEHDNLKNKLNGKAINYQELKDISSFILNGEIELPEQVLKLYDMMLREYSKQLNYYVSDRKANKMLNILKASAVLNLRTTVRFEDIEPIKYALVTLHNDQQEEVFRAVYTKLMSDNVKYDAALKEIEKLTKTYDGLYKSYNNKLNPKSKDILELNEEAQAFYRELQNHHFREGCSFNDIAPKFNDIYSGTERIIKEVSRALGFGG